ncbi:MAG: hypothetical protein JW904_01555 [Spirochaetales bacterium]|nr:hypothetical protein [Spirochaetales bacterium]
MKTYTLFQKILAIGDTYEVREGDSKEAVFTVRGKVLTFTPNLTLQKGKEGEKTHSLKGNFFKTKFTILNATGEEMGTLVFPFIALKKSFTLTMGGNTYSAQGTLFAWNFNCNDSSGKTIFSIQKELAFRDKFTVNIDEKMPQEAVLLAAIAVDQRFFQQK